MAERKRLFILYLTRFREVWQPSPWLNLQHEFKTREVSLSQSLLIWGQESGAYLLSDFENKKTYEIQGAEDPDGQPTMEVWEQSSEAEQPVTLEGIEVILDHLQRAQGTDQGFIDFLKRINLDELNLEGLKRSDLSGAGFSFESVHQELLIVHSMLREILTSPRESLLNFSRVVVQDLKNYLPQFYENVQKIENFQISNENPREAYDNLLQNISNSCGNVKEPLGRIIAYLSSRKVGELETEVDATVSAAVDRLDAETNRTKETNNATEKVLAEIEERLEKKEEEVDQLTLKMQNQLAEKPISQYKAIFADQAKEYHKEAQNWLWIGDWDNCCVLWSFLLVANIARIRHSWVDWDLAKSLCKGISAFSNLLVA